MNIKQDRYILGQSESKSIQELGGKIRLDITLKEKITSIGSSVEGVVVDEASAPVSNALIKIMDSNFEPLMHAVTNERGEYLFNNIPISNSYTIFAIAEGKKLNQDKQFALTQTESKEINFILEEDSAMSLGIIAGDLYKNGTTSPINGAIASLYALYGKKEKLVAITNTNEYGQFVFSEVTKAKYNIKISSLGYMPDSIGVEIITDSQILLIKPTLSVDPITERGTVSGLITNEISAPVPRADVILYRVDGDNLIPVAFTKTNISGVYLFINVPQGTYKIKSNEIEIKKTDVIDPVIPIIPVAKNKKNDTNIAPLMTAPLYIIDQYSNSDLIMIDGNNDNYTTSFGGPLNRDIDYWGIEFDDNYGFNELVYTSGKKFVDGGWFITTPKIQVRQDIDVSGEEKWVDVSLLTIRPDIIDGTEGDTNYTFKFKDIIGDAIRIIGKPYQHTNGVTFTSITELEVYYRDTK